MSHVACAFGMVFKIIAFLFEILALLALIAVLGLGGNFPDDPNTTVDESQYSVEIGAAIYISLVFVFIMLIYDIIFFVFIVKGFIAFKKDNEA